jgi:hypothetical protein
MGGPVVAPRRVIALPTDAEQREVLREISRSRTVPASRVERARIILAYLEDPSAYENWGRPEAVTTFQPLSRCMGIASRAVQNPTPHATGPMKLALPRSNG